MAEATSFTEKLIAIQQEYIASKTENNEFGGYQYRNIEKMLGTLKPLLKKHDLFIFFTDELVNMGDRYYVKATATITDGKDEVSASSLAREEYEKKKSDASQLTGSASTYARKYALSGLLGVDDGDNDPDSKDNDRKQYQKPSGTAAAGKQATDKQIKAIYDTVSRLTGIDNKEDMDAWLDDRVGATPEKLSVKAAGAVITKLFAAEKQKQADGIKASQEPDTIFDVTDEPIDLDKVPY